jgi:hypothetical protein
MTTLAPRIVDVPACEIGIAAFQMAEDLVQRIEGATPTLDEVRRLRERVAELGARLDTWEQRPKPTSGLLYVWKASEEARWFVLSVAAPVVIAALEDIGNITNYKAWLFGIGVAVVRPLGGRLLALLARRQLPAGTPTPPA